MTRKKMGSRLADSLRQARGDSTQTPGPASAAPVTATPAPAKPAVQASVARPATDTAPVVRRQPAPGRYAGQTDQSPPPSLDRLWDNLHPARIWPD